MVSEAKLETLPEGLGAEGPGWFVLNARDARWWQRAGLGRWADLEGDGDFEQLGIRIAVLQPGEPIRHVPRARRVRRTSSSSPASACSSSRARSAA